MSKIDIQNWAKHDINSLFTLSLSRGDNQAKKLKEGSIPLVSSGKNNNGICKYIKEGDGVAELYDANTITIDMFGKAFYQPKPYYAVSHGRVNILIPKFKLTPNIALFLIAVFDASFCKKYSFSGMCNQKELLKEYVFLPSISDTQPDWKYMEQYIRKKRRIVGNYLELLNSCNNDINI